MAGEEDEASKTADEPRSGMSRGRRRRPDVILDLAATPVAPATGLAASADAPALGANEPATLPRQSPGEDASATASPGDAAAAISPGVHGREPGEPDRLEETPGVAAGTLHAGAAPAGEADSPYWALPRFGLIHLGAAAAGGAIIAVVLVLILAALGLVSEPAARLAREAAGRADEAAAAGQRASTLLRNDLDALRRAPAGPTLANLQALADRIGKVEGDAARIAALEDRLRAISATPATDGATAAQIARLGADVAALRQQVEALAARAAPAAAPGAGERALVDALTARLDGLAARVETTAGTADRVRAFEQSARVMTATSLAAAAGRGDGFAAELEALRALGVGEPLIGALLPMAGGVPPLAGLQGRFAKVGDAIIDAAYRPAGDAGLGERLLYQARSLVSVRPTGPVAGDSAEAIVSRMQAKVASGDLAGALAEREALRAPSKDASAAWAKDAAARLALVEAVAALNRGVSAQTPAR